MTGAQCKWEKRWERGWRQLGRGSSEKGSMEASRRGRGGSEGPRGGCCSHSGELCGQAKALGCRAKVRGVNTCAESLARARVPAGREMRVRVSRSKVERWLSWRPEQVAKTPGPHASLLE